MYKYESTYCTSPLSRSNLSLRIRYPKIDSFLRQPTMDSKPPWMIPFTRGSVPTMAEVTYLLCDWANVSARRMFPAAPLTCNCPPMKGKRKRPISLGITSPPRDDVAYPSGSYFHNPKLMHFVVQDHSPSSISG